MCTPSCNTCSVCRDSDGDGSGVVMVIVMVVLLLTMTVVAVMMVAVMVRVLIATVGSFSGGGVVYPASASVGTHQPAPHTSCCSTHFLSPALQSAPVACGQRGCRGCLSLLMDR